MSLRYNNLNLYINSQPIMATSLSINQNSETKGVNTFNNSFIFDNIPQGIKNTINVEYFIECNNEPIYSSITGWKFNPDQSITGILNIGGIIITGYLNNYGFNLLNNQHIKAQASYQVFSPITGLYMVQSNQDGNLYNALNSSGLAHYWSSNFHSGDSIISDNQILQLDYNFSTNIIPSYSLGNSIPTQISTITAVETISIINEIQNNLIFNSSGLNEIFNGIDGLKLKSISTLWSTGSEIFISLTGMESQTNKIEINTNSPLLFNHSFAKSF